MTILELLWTEVQLRSTQLANNNVLTPSEEKGMATHSRTLAWKIPWTEKPGRLQSMGSLRVGHDWATSLSFFTFMHWRRKWQPIPVFLPGESQGQRSLVGCHLWDCTSRTRLKRLSSSSSIFLGRILGIESCSVPCKNRNFTLKQGCANHT